MDGLHLPPPHPTRVPAWHWRALGWAPHRLSFAAGLLLVVLSSLWWLGTQWARQGWWPGWPQPLLASTTIHATLMVFGFMPLFFCGFSHTAGPKWLEVPPLSTRQVLWPVSGLTLGCLAWLLGAHLYLPLAWAGLLLAAAGWALLVGQLLGLIRRSRLPNRVHAQVLLGAGVLGTLALLGLLWALSQQQGELARLCLHTGLWGSVVPTFVTVAHRMLPFFTHSALPGMRLWRPLWLLPALLLAPLLQLVSAWAAYAPLTGDWWPWLHPFALLVLGWLLLWLSVVWGLLPSFKVRLLAMLHIGFAWLGLAFLLEGIGLVWQLLGGASAWPLGSLHATTLGFLGSTLMAMVTRVSSGHGGRPLRADRFFWLLFLLLQQATLARILADMTSPPLSAWLTVLAALLWTLATAPWALRLLFWFGRANPMP